MTIWLPIPICRVCVGCGVSPCIPPRVECVQCEGGDFAGCLEIIISGITGDFAYFNGTHNVAFAPGVGSCEWVQSSNRNYIRIYWHTSGEWWNIDITVRSAEGDTFGCILGGLSPETAQHTNPCDPTGHYDQFGLPPNLVDAEISEYVAAP